VPIYEYACGSCRSRFEVQQKMSDPPLSTCTKCGAAVTKVISAPAIMFKGSGWYVTDYSEKLKPPSGTESDGKPAGDAKPPSEAKPADTTSGSGSASTAATAPADSSPSSTPGSNSGSS